MPLLFPLFFLVRDEVLDIVKARLEVFVLGFQLFDAFEQVLPTADSHAFYSLRVLNFDPPPFGVVFQRFVLDLVGPLRVVQNIAR